MWAINRKEQENLAIWKKNIIRKIIGGVKLTENLWRRTNKELQESYDRSSQKAKWLAHVLRMDDRRWTKKLRFLQAKLKLETNAKTNQAMIGGKFYTLKLANIKTTNV